jgi:rhodanese-related sulfurtransferase
MIPQVRPSQLSAWLESLGPNPGQALLLDVREPAEWATASVDADKLPGVEVVKIAMNSIPGQLSQLDPGRPTACLCHHGARSQRVAAFLVAQGFTQVANVAGGIDAWSAELDAGVPRY